MKTKGSVELIVVGLLAALMFVLAIPLFAGTEASHSSPVEQSAR